ncbi:hypothetical protein G7Y89_g13701 [Cudoniella acicularis]|uniref:2EXR domain-containing protein n=1 Tax=Cudoniella acicularis TaxID=354080 RepID=A0A8H4R6R2_9HELO|nr:hypothetical protein G7Y89_g13701 [Cudoniella acicularis]
MAEVLQPDDTLVSQLESTLVLQLVATPSFTLFPLLPTELRLKIWEHVHENAPPQKLPFYLCKSDLDFLRLKRKACHNYPHIFAGAMSSVPPLLHVSQEARSVALQHYSVGFDISRMVSLGRHETDVDTYTTCSHEVAMEEENKKIYWDRNKDVVFLDEGGWMGEGKARYVWGGKTGVRFGKMHTVMITYLTLKACIMGGYLSWEGIETLLVLLPAHWKRGVHMGLLNEARRDVHLFLKNMGIEAGEARAVEVKIGCDLEKLVDPDFVTL